MKITPQEIVCKTFPKKMLGVDETAVMSFLQEVSVGFENLIRENNILKETLKEKMTLIAENNLKSNSLQSTIQSASTMADKYRTDAERESRFIIADAQQKAEMIVRDAKDSLKKLYNDIAELKKARLQFEANMRALTQAHLSLLDQSQTYLPAFQMPNLTFDQGLEKTLTPIPEKKNTFKIPEHMPEIEE
jgi:cell division initiation protein